MKIRYIPAAVLFMMGCSAHETVPSFQPVFTPGPHVLVYKTTKNYNHHVPVILSEDKTTIVSYPSPKDIQTEGKYHYPTLLKKGYLMDNRGIGKNVAFLKYTYEEYAQLEHAPDMETLYQSILDKNPLTEMCDCGIRTAFTHPEKQLNRLIAKKQLQTVCKILP